MTSEQLSAKHQELVDRYDGCADSAFVSVLDSFSPDLLERSLAAAQRTFAAAVATRQDALQSWAPRVKRVRAEQAEPSDGVGLAGIVGALTSLGQCCERGCAARLLADSQRTALATFAARMEALGAEARRAVLNMCVAISYTDRGGQRHRANSLHPFGALCQRAFDAVVFQARHPSTAAMRLQRLPGDCALAPVDGRVGVESNGSSRRGGRWVLGEALLRCLRDSCEQLPLSIARCKKAHLSDVGEVFLLPSRFSQQVVFDLYIDFWRRVRQQLSESSSFFSNLDSDVRDAVVSAATRPPVSLSSFIRQWQADKELHTIRTRDADKMVCDTCACLEVDRERAAAPLSDASDDARAAAHARLAQIDQDYAQHLQEAIARRRQYQADVMFVRCLARQVPTVGLRNENPPLAAPVVQITFDYAHALPVPHRARPPAGWFFAFQYDLRWFGLRRDELGEMFHYLYRPDEGASGGNDVISLIHLHFKHNPPPPGSTLIIYADHCSGQNKTFAMMFYLSTLVLLGVFSRIIMRFMLPGHTHNRVDGAFGIVKQYYARRDVNIASDVANMIEEIKNQHAEVVEPWCLRDWSRAAAPFFRTGSQLSAQGAFLRVSRELEFSSATPGYLVARSSRLAPSTIDLLRLSFHDRFDDSLSRLRAVYESFYDSSVVKPLPLPNGISDRAYTQLVEKIVPCIRDDAARAELLRRPTASEPQQPADDVAEVVDDPTDVPDAAALPAGEVLAQLQADSARVLEPSLCSFCSLVCDRDFLVCSGVCERLFHVACVRTDAASEGDAQESPGALVFVCSECSNSST